MSDITATELTPESPIPFDYPEGLKAAAEYAFNHIERDPGSGKVAGYIGGFEIDPNDTANLPQLMLAYVMSIFWQ